MQRTQSRRGGACLICAASFVLLASPGKAETTFNKDVAPIIYTQCATCHRPGATVPFSLLTYSEVRQRATQIAAVTKSRYMPPWKPDPGFGEFAGARRLTDSEIAVIQQWAAEGAIEGDARNRPPVPEWPGSWSLGQPDLIVSMPDPFLLPAGGPDVFRTFVLPLNVARGRNIAAVEFRPESAAIHHANLKIDRTRGSRRLDEEDPGPGFDGGGSREARFPDGHFLGWTPGQLPERDRDTSWRLEPGSDLVVEAHMLPTGRTESIRVSVGLYFAEQPGTRLPYMLRLGRQTIDIPPGEPRHVVTDSYVLPVDVDLLRVQPHAHLLARRVQAFAQLPDGSRRSLIRIGDWDFRWQEIYRYAQPVRLPRGTTIVTEFTYDNSDRNPRNPNRPAKRVTFGQKTSSEMGDVWFQVVTVSDSERAVLHADYAPKMLREDIAGVEQALAEEPADARLHTDLALCYLEADRPADALAHLREAVRLEPGSAAAQYELGTLLLRRNELDDAREHFARAVAVKPAFSEAHNNIGVSFFLGGKLPEAIRAFELAVQADAGNTEAHFNLATVLDALAGASIADGDIARGVELARAALEHAARTGDEQLASAIRKRLATADRDRAIR